MAGSDTDRVEIDAVLKHETAKAWLLEFADVGEKWFAKSMVHWNPDDKKAEMPEWLAQKEGLI
jgi:hypothetical protein